MKTLYLSRHAKAEKGFADINDFDRPLTHRGILDAARMGSLLKQRNIIPSVFITSPAIRALSTAFIFAHEMGYPWDKIRIDENIYEASAEALLQVIRSVNDEHGSVMLFGHNPAFTDAANVLTAGTFENIPTSGVVCMEFDTQSWKKADPGTGRLRSFDTPKNLV